MATFHRPTIRTLVRVARLALTKAYNIAMCERRDTTINVTAQLGLYAVMLGLAAYTAMSQLLLGYSSAWVPVISFAAISGLPIFEVVRLLLVLRELREV